MRWFSTYSTSLNGPVPIVALPASSRLFTSTMPEYGSHRQFGKTGFGVLVVIFNVLPSASMDAIFNSCAARLCMEQVRNREAFTASASTGFPLWKSTPSRSSIVQASPSSETEYSFTRFFSTFKFSSNRNNDSMTPVRMPTQAYAPEAGSTLPT